MTKTLNDFWKLIKLSFNEFVDDNSLRLSASLSYYTIFSMAPMLIIIISVAGIFFGVDAVEGKVYHQIKGLVGSDAAKQIQLIIKNIKLSQHSRSGVIIGSVILIIGASGVFTEIQDSINYLWSIKAKPKQNWVKLIVNRLLSFSLITAFGFLLFVSLLGNALFDLLSDHLQLFFADGVIYLFYFLNVVFILLVTSLMFAFIFKILPDAVIRWRDAFIGGLVTAILFTGGKLMISAYVGYSNIDVIYGTTASIIVILLWVYYSSIILFFGASFTKYYSIHCGGNIIPKNNAVFMETQEKKGSKMQ